MDSIGKYEYETGVSLYNDKLFVLSIFIKNDQDNTIEEKVKNNEFLEYANVHGNYYGTLKGEVEARLDRGENVILEIDVQGGIQVREKYPDAHLIFFKTPCNEDLERRLRGRGTDPEEVVQLRLANSIKELATPINGLSKSSSLSPVALNKDL